MVDLADGVLLSFNCHPPVLPVRRRVGCWKVYCLVRRLMITPHPLTFSFPFSFSFPSLAVSYRYARAQTYTRVGVVSTANNGYPGAVGAQCVRLIDRCGAVFCFFFFGLFCCLCRFLSSLHSLHSPSPSFSRECSKRRLPAQRGDHHLLAVLVPGAHTAVPAAAHLQRRPCGWPAHLSAAGGDPTGTGGHHHGHHGGIQSPGVRTGLRGGPAALQPYRRRVAGRESVIVVVVDRTRKDLKIFVVNTQPGLPPDRLFYITRQRVGEAKGKRETWSPRLASPRRSWHCRRLRLQKRSRRSAPRC